MNVYVIETYDVAIGKCLIAANDYNEAGRIFNEHFSYATKNPIKNWNCKIYSCTTLQTNINTPQMLFNNIYC